MLSFWFSFSIRFFILTAICIQYFPFSFLYLFSFHTIQILFLPFCMCRFKLSFQMFWISACKNPIASQPHGVIRSKNQSKEFHNWFINVLKMRICIRTSGCFLQKLFYLLLNSFFNAFSLRKQILKFFLLLPLWIYHDLLNSQKLIIFLPKRVWIRIRR